MLQRKMNSGSRSVAHRRGQALVEFAIISFVLSAIVAGLLGIMVLALGSFQNNIAAEGAGRILDQHEELTEANFLTHFGLDPLEFSIEDATAEQVYRFLNEFGVDSYNLPAVDGEGDPVLDEEGEQTYDTFPLPLYDETLLILSAADYFHYVDSDNAHELPAINRLLLPSYIYDPDVASPADEDDQGAYRYPGAVVTNGSGDSTVLIPLLDDDRDGNTISGLARTFNIDPTDIDPENENDYAFPVSVNWVAPVTVVKCDECGDVDNGVAFKLVIFYPSQPASMISLEVVRDAEGRIESQTPVEADDEALETQQSGLATLPTGYEPLTVASDVTLEENSAFGASASRGKYGLGESYAFLMKVRPYRRVFETASVFRLQQDRLIAKYSFDSSAASKELDDGVEEPFRVLAPEIERGFDPSADESPNAVLRLVNPSDEDSEQLELIVPESARGLWRITVAAEFELTGGASTWVPGHEFELKLDHEGADHTVDAHSQLDEDNDPIQLCGETVLFAEDGDTIQVRVHTAHPDPSNAAYQVQLTGDRERNWVTYEFLGDR